TIVSTRLSAFGSTRTLTRRFTGASACRGDTFMLMHSFASEGVTEVTTKKDSGMSQDALCFIWILLSTTTRMTTNSAAARQPLTFGESGSSLQIGNGARLFRVFRQRGAIKCRATRWDACFANC